MSGTKIIHCVPKNVHLLFFQYLCQKLTDFNVFLVCEILRKFDIDSLYICPPYLYTVTTLPREILKSHFSTVLLVETSDYYIISEETNCNCCTAAYLFTYCCLLFPIICVALFYGQFFLSLWSVIFKATNAKERNIICSQI